MGKNKDRCSEIEIEVLTEEHGEGARSLDEWAGLIGETALLAELGLVVAAMVFGKAGADKDRDGEKAVRIKIPFDVVAPLCCAKNAGALKDMIARLRRIAREEGLEQYPFCVPYRTEQ